MEPIVELNQDRMAGLSLEQKQAFVASCPRKVYSYDAMRQSVEIEDAGKCNLCDECNKYATEEGHPGTVRLDERQNKFIYTVEATGALPPATIVRKAMHVLKAKLRELSSSV